jgi:hypothetical protein
MVLLGDGVTTKPASELQLGDMVATPTTTTEVEEEEGGGFEQRRVSSSWSSEPVLAFSHRDMQATSSMVELQTANGQSLTLSPAHLVPAAMVSQLLLLSNHHHHHNHPVV